MGWRDRDYARFNEHERRAFFGPGTTTARRATTTTKATAVAIALSLALFLAGRYPTAHPLIPALHFKIPAWHADANRTPPQTHHRLRLDVPGTAVVGSNLNIWGTLRGYHGRLVTLEGSLDGGAWTVLGSGRLDSTGRFTVSLRYTGPGTQRLRLSYPNGDVAVGVVTVQ